jgi:galactose mutarotase-like enzyme
MTLTFIQNARLRVGVTPAYGARVVNLVDLGSGREWMTQGPQSANTGEDAVYAGDEAVAWDECFPTVGSFDASDTPWRRRLRDHGDLWGRPWRVDAAETDRLALSYEDSQFRFARELRLEGPALVARYEVTNLGNESLPYLWALHALFAVTPGDRMELPGVETVRGSYVSLRGERKAAARLNWSGPNDVLPFALEDVQPPETIFAAKFLAGGLPAGSARLGRPGQWLEIAWDRSIEHLGIWLTYGGWPGPGGHNEAALEPTSAEANHLGEAIASGAPALAPGERRTWQVTLTVGV